MSGSFRSAVAASAPAPYTRTSAGSPLVSPFAAAQLPEAYCPYCRAEIATEAQKCRACGEWVVRTSAGVGAALLRLVGWLWVAASGVVAFAVWVAASTARARFLATTVDDTFATPRLLSAAVYALVALVLLQGLAAGLGLTVLAGLAPRRPRWWVPRGRLR